MRPVGAAVLQIDVTGEITLELAHAVERALDTYPAHSVELVVDTRGGRWDASRHIFECLVAHSKRVTAFVERAYSGGALVVMGADFRQMNPNGTFLLHWPTSDYGATSGFDEVAATKAKLMARACRIPTTRFLRWMRETTTIDAKRALAYGLVDAVPGLPKPLPTVFL